MMSESDNINIAGGHVVAGNIGGSGNYGTISGPVYITNTTPGDGIEQVVQQLRASLDQLQQQLAASTGMEAQPGDVETVLDQLDPEHPDPAKAMSRWNLLFSRIPGPLKNIDTVTKIVTLMTQLHQLAG